MGKALLYHEETGAGSVNIMKNNDFDTDPVAGSEDLILKTMILIQDPVAGSADPMKKQCV